MKKIIFFLIALIPLFAFSENIQIKVGDELWEYDTKLISKKGNIRSLTVVVYNNYGKTYLNNNGDTYLKTVDLFCTMNCDERTVKLDEVRDYRRDGRLIRINKPAERPNENAVMFRILRDVCSR